MRVRTLAAFAAVVMCACDAPAKAPAPTYKTVPISPLLQGEERLIEFEDAAQRPDNLVWHSTNENIAQVTPEGRVRGMAPGTVVVQGTSARGPLELHVKVSAARLAWTRLLPLGPRTFLSVSDQGIFAKTVRDARCSVDCPGELHVLSPAGETVTTVAEIGSVIAGATVAWLESAGGILRYDYATAATQPVFTRGQLFAVYAGGDLLIGVGTRLVRATPQGAVVWSREFSGEVQRAIISTDTEIVMADRRLFLSRADGNQELEVDGPRSPWATDRSGAAILSDSVGYNFALYLPTSGYRLLLGVHSVLVGDGGLLESEGLSASLNVPVAALADGGTVFIEMHSYGPAGHEHSFDIVRREGDLLQWRWGPSKCTDHPFATASGAGYTVIAGCDRIVRIDDRTLNVAGSWPQPGADAARSWRVQ